MPRSGREKQLGQSYDKNQTFQLDARGQQPNWHRGSNTSYLRSQKVPAGDFPRSQGQACLHYGHQALGDLAPAHLSSLGSSPSHSHSPPRPFHLSSFVSPARGAALFTWHIIYLISKQHSGLGRFLGLIFSLEGRSQRFLTHWNKDELQRRPRRGCPSGAGTPGCGVPLTD